MRVRTVASKNQIVVRFLSVSLLRTLCSTHVINCMFSLLIITQLTTWCCTIRNDFTEAKTKQLITVNQLNLTFILTARVSQDSLQKVHILALVNPRRFASYASTLIIWFKDNRNATDNAHFQVHANIYYYCYYLLPSSFTPCSHSFVLVVTLSPSLISPCFFPVPFNLKATVGDISHFTYYSILHFHSS
jgi:hypothetical protein